MPIHNPPMYRYALYEAWDRQAYEYIKQLGASRQYPPVLGSTAGKQQLLTTLIRTQKSPRDWRLMPQDILQSSKDANQIDTYSLNRKYPPESISKEVPAWVTYREDETVNTFIDELATRRIAFEGTGDEFAEFIFRFILGQLGHDWEQTILMIWEILGTGNELSLEKLNKEMANFDYMKLFAAIQDRTT